MDDTMNTVTTDPEGGRLASDAIRQAEAFKAEWQAKYPGYAAGIRDLLLMENAAEEANARLHAHVQRQKLADEAAATTGQPAAPARQSAGWDRPMTAGDHMARAQADRVAIGAARPGLASLAEGLAVTRFGDVVRLPGVDGAPHTTKPDVPFWWPDA